MSVEIVKAIMQGKTFLGIEFGSTRIKAVLIGENHKLIASGAHDWENQLENGHWTYSEDNILSGLKSCYKSLCLDVKKKYNVVLENVSAMGFSAMMHGYLAFDKDGDLLVPFRTWRNTNTGNSARELTELFGFNIPHRWSIAHLYQAILNDEIHVEKINYITTLAGFIHWKLTGEKVLGIGDASGMFPINSDKNDYDNDMLNKFDQLIADRNYPWKIRDILPKVLIAGENAGTLTKKGTSFLDESGILKDGIPLCPPEGDAGTGMIATNSIAMRTGNVSAGTSIFAMIVLEKALSKLYFEIDMVNTPHGKPVAMVHCNNCTSDINAWAKLFADFLKAVGACVDMNKIYSSMFEQALKGDEDCGKILSYNYFSGEPITNLDEGRPLLVRMADSDFSFSNMMKSIMFSALATLKIGMNILENENVKIDRILGHGGFFKSGIPPQRLMASALKTKVSLMESASDGGPWGMAILSAFMVKKSSETSLEDYLENQVFADFKATSVEPDEDDAKSFEKFLEKYILGLEIERKAVENFTD